MDIVQMIKLVSNVEDPVKTYCDCRMPIAVERSDASQDWHVLKLSMAIDGDFFLRHLEMTKGVFKYNVFELPQEEQDDLLGATTVPRPSSGSCAAACPRACR